MPSASSPVRPPHVATTLLPVRSVWRYLAGPTDAGTSWRHPAYDDVAWPSGPGVLGFGEPYIATGVPAGDPSNRYTTIYFRTTFVVNQDPATLQNLSLLTNYDDGFVAYLNGVEVARRGLPAGPVNYNTFAVSHEGGAYEAIDIAAAAPLLMQGTSAR